MKRCIRRAAVQGGMLLIFSIFAQGCRSPRVEIGDPDVSPPSKMDRSEARVASGQLNVAVTVAESTDEGRLVGDRIRTIVESSLVSAGYRVNAERPEVLVNLQLEASLWDQTGPYFVFKGANKAEILRVYDRKLLGAERFAGEGARIQDRGDALISLADKLGAPTAKWAKEKAAPSSVGVLVADITLRHSWYNIDRKKPEFVQTFIQLVGQLDGVISCRLARENVPARERVFRVVYIEDKVPEGILNRIASLKELDIKLKGR